jgi:Ran-binding protein 3
MNESLETTHEEDEAITPPDSPNKIQHDDDMLSTSPPYETKVKQISRKVKGMKWDDRDRDRPQSQTETAMDTEPQTPEEGADTQLSPAAEIMKETAPTETADTNTEDKTIPKNKDTETSPPEAESGAAKPPPDSTETKSTESDSDDQGEMLKRKMDDRVPGVSLEDSSSSSKRISSGSELSKRLRDDEEDANPREKKRPTPPPEAREADETEQNVVDTEPVAPQAKVVSSFQNASVRSN